MTSKHILLLSDGKAGHVSTSRGMVALAENSATGVHTTELNVHLRAKFLRPLLRILVNSGCNRHFDTWLGLHWPRMFYQGYRSLPVDLAISTGGDTLYLNVIEGSRGNCKNIFCGSLRGVNADRISLVVHTRKSDLPNWQTMRVLPSAVRLEQTKAAASTFADTRLNGRREGLWSLLIGGDGSGYHFKDTEILEILMHTTDLATKHGKRLLVTTSRRTGIAAERLIAEWLATHPSTPIEACVLYGQQPDKVAAAFMGLAECVFCTEDSTSMISESVLHQRPVITLSASKASPVTDHSNFLLHLTKAAHIQRCRLSDLKALNLQPFLSTWRAYDGEDHRNLSERISALLNAPVPAEA